MVSAISGSARRASMRRPPISMPLSAATASLAARSGAMLTRPCRFGVPVAASRARKAPTTIP
jgi:hypothetical protein